MINFEDYQANWIWSDITTTVNSYVRFIQEFDVSEETEAKLLISADTNYAAFINGQLAGYGQYSDYPFYKVYDEHDIGHLLEKGKNKLCIMGYYQGEDSSQYYKADAGIIFAVTSHNGLLTSSGKQTLHTTCPAYESGKMENISPQLSFTFKYNAIYDDNWLDKNYDTMNWEKCFIISKTLSLYERPIKKLYTENRVTSILCAQGLLQRDETDNEIGLLMFRDYLSARRINELSSNKVQDCKLMEGEPLVVSRSKTEERGVYLVFDLGREESGLLDIELEAEEGTVLEIGYSEHLDDLRVRSYVGGRNFACRYVTKNGRQRFMHYFKRIGCRYIQINVLNFVHDFSIYYVGLLPVHYPVKHTKIEIKDKLFERIYKVGVRTLELCMHEHYEDCPWREQALYAMDSRNQALCGYYAFQEYDFPESCIRLLALGLKEDGLMELCAPARVPITIPSFSFIWILELFEFWKHSGRKEFVSEMFHTVEKICNNAISRMDKGLIPCYLGQRYWNFYEWSEGLDGMQNSDENEQGTRFDAPLNMFLKIALDSAAILAKEIGKDDTAKYWEECSEILRQRTRETFLDSVSGIFYTFKKDGGRWHLSELTQALALYSGCVNQVEENNLREILVNKCNGLVSINLSYLCFKYDALLQDEESYKQWVFDDISDIWGDMLFKGATSFWETYHGGSDFENAGSLCHGWSAIPVYYLSKYL
jgi:hypothetical protein